MYAIDHNDRGTPAPADGAASVSCEIDGAQVTVPAGTFRALHVAGASGHSDSWVDPDLPFALVKEAGNDEGQSQMVLVSHGTGAQSRITERPRPFDARLFMQAVTGARAAPPN